MDGCTHRPDHPGIDVGTCGRQQSKTHICKDVVNIKKEVKSEGVARVSFLGAGGHEIQIDCPKVGATYTPFAKTHFLVNTSCLLTVPWAEQDTYILEAGLQNDVELPYTCRGGICGYDLSPFLVYA